MPYEHRVTDVFCEHGRTADHCEDCAFQDGLERGVIEPGRKLHPDRPADDVKVAAKDELVPRPDLGDKAFTQVIAGQPVPPDVADPVVKRARASK